ncbi:uncharacterized protein [Ptychodera flava]|uniref:uncharacterized protein n=1 Tax=Ptychodera flava TaxID=63121 RepID=UPI00396A602B
MEVVLILLSLTSVLAQQAPLLNFDLPDKIKDEYIVEFYSNATDDQVLKHMKMLTVLLEGTNDVEKAGITREYNFGGFKAYAFRGNIEAVNFIRRMPEVKHIEANHVVKALQSCYQQTFAEWGLVRSTERGLNLSGIYRYTSNTGEGVDVYILDTGIYLQHNDFEGRAVWGTDTVETPSPKRDGNGHGTHVAGSVMGTRYGLAKDATAIAVRVLDDAGSGTLQMVIDGVNWVAQHYQDKRKQTNSAKGAVANMSLGGPFSQSENNAVAAAIRTGISFVVAAGNEKADACDTSPASEPSAITVAATNSADLQWESTNYGRCVDILAPGEGITAAWIDSPYSITTITGTSMAAPHVAGAIAKYLSAQSRVPSPSAVKSWLDTSTTKDRIQLAPWAKFAGTPNKLLYYKEC